jgi:DNA topoisomerase-1
LLASDEDQGEAISWHLAEELKLDKTKQNELFHEITKTAILKAIDNPVKLIII